MSDTHETAAAVDPIQEPEAAPTPNLTAGADPEATTTSSGPDTGKDEPQPAADKANAIDRIVASLHSLKHRGFHATAIASLADALDAIAQATEDGKKLRAFSVGAILRCRDNQGTSYGTTVAMLGSPVLLDSLVATSRRKLDDQFQQMEMKAEMKEILKALLK